MSETTLQSAAIETPSFEPWRAANLSMMLPGLGQWEAGERARGLFFGVTSVVLWLLAVLFFAVPRLPGWVGMLLVLPSAAIDLWAIVDAHRRAKAANTVEQEAARTSRRDAWKAVFLNRLLPGLGHAYEGRWGGAIAWFLGFVVVLLLPKPLDALGAGAVLAGAVWRGWARTRARPVPDRSLLLAVVMAASIWSAAYIAVPDWLRENVIQFFRIPSASMLPTLQPGDGVVVDKRPFVPRDGDLVVYPYPREPSKLFLKRVLALPGEVVEFRADGVYRDGQRVMATRGRFEVPGDVPLLADEGHPYRVPDGEAFLIGDNLASSHDSRFHGPIPIAKLRGRAYKTYWPPGRARSFP